jgi:hypothetical protein
MAGGTVPGGTIQLMSNLTTRLLVSAAAAAALLACQPAWSTGKAQKKPASFDTFYRCKDARGQSYIGQAIPAECMEADVDVIDHRGRVIRVIPGKLSKDQIAQQKADAEAAVAAAQRDRTLLATYLTVADIERLRDQRIEQLEQQAVVTRSYIANLRSRQGRLMQDVQRYHPYSDRPKAPPLPVTMAEEIVNTVNGLRVYEQELTKNTADQEQLRTAFDADIARFKELKGLH